jgi:hypothetical protein
MTVDPVLLDALPKKRKNPANRDSHKSIAWPDEVAGFFRDPVHRWWR